MSITTSNTRLQQELLRLYSSDDTALATPARAAVLELARPADWSALGAVWRGVQGDLGLPAPAIAVTGSDGFQLWFSLAEDSLAPEAGQLLQALCRAYLPGLKPATRLRLWSAAMDGAAPSLPPQRAGAEQWSAFVAPDLAPVFSAEPWLDTEPGPEAQADVLSRLACIGAAPLRAALLQLQGPRDAVPPAPLPSLPADASEPDSEPRRFLLRVMQDDTVAMALRIEAAKALLQAPR
ncbi:MAG: hypothetical protein C0423_07170 [Methylibium sp.]|nr:hypothetical protein [Methylibium sp.]